MTTEQGVTIADDENSLRAGARGPALMDDFILREKLTHFDHERIPERVVHARGAGAHGYFQVYESLAGITSAAFLQDPTARTPVFVRFSTVAGSRGSADTVRDLRGFATKFYTSEGNFDLVGNNAPVFFIQDAIKFPDLVHALKPEPSTEIPQASSAHDTFWDFVWLTPEATHAVMWLMSDRGIPRSFSMMEGFGVHTFRMVSAQGTSRFVKFHWRPVLGVHSLVWDEAQQLAGRDPDFLRRDLADAIESGNFPEFEFALQVIEERDAAALEFDVLDATKLWPEEIVPLRRVGKMVLNRNPENFFAETEQVAFHLGNLVPGIDVSDDPLLQGRLFSYLDTQLLRLGGPNFPQLPINQPHTVVQNNQRDGYHQTRIDSGPISYSPNSLRDTPSADARPSGSAFHSYAATIGGRKERVRSERFGDHFSQAALFYRSMSSIEQQHIVAALRFELGKVRATHVRERVVDLLVSVELDLARAVAVGVGVAVPPSNRAKATSAANARLRLGWETYGVTSLPGASRRSTLDVSPALSQLAPPAEPPNARGRKFAVLAANGVDATSLARIVRALGRAHASGEVVADRLGVLTGTDGSEVDVAHTLLTMPSVMYDGVFVPGGVESVRTLLANGDAVRYLAEAYAHKKPIAADVDGEALLEAAGIELQTATDASGVVLARNGTAREMPSRWIRALAHHRFFERAASADLSR